MAGPTGQFDHTPPRADTGGEADLAPLLKRASAGDPIAWRTIVDLYARRVYALARSRLGSTGMRSAGAAAGRTPIDTHSNSRRSGYSEPIAAIGQGGGDSDAEEVTQSVFVTVASKLAGGDYTEVGRFEAWLFRIAMNRIRDEARRRKRQARPTDPSLMPGVAGETASGSSATLTEGDPRSGQPQALDKRLMFEALRQAIEELPEADREVIELRHHAGMSFKEMSDVLSEPLGTLLARHHRALRKLKELLPPSVRGAFEDTGPSTGDSSGVSDTGGQGEAVRSRGPGTGGEGAGESRASARTPPLGRSTPEIGGLS